MENTGQTILIKNISNGGLFEEPISNAQALINQGTHIPANPEEVKQVSISKKFGTPGYQARAAVEEAASTASLGLSRQAQRLIAPETLEESRYAAEENPISTNVGMAAGVFVDPFAASPLKLAEKVGEKVASKALKPVAQALEKTKSPFVNKLIAEIPQAAVRGSIVGGAIGAGQEISEEALGDTDLNGEKILASAGHGALLGGLLEGGLKTLTVGTGEIASRAAKSFDKLNIGDKAFNAYAKVSGAVSGASKEEILAMRELQREAQSGIDKFKSPGSFENVTSQLDTTLGDASDVTRYETGKKVLGNVKNVTQETQEKFNQAYTPLREKYSQVALPEGFTNKVIDGIKKDLVKGSESYKLIDQYEDAILGAKSADDLKSIATAVNETIRNKQGGFGYDIIEGIKDAEVNSVLKAAEKLGDAQTVKEAEGLISSLKDIDSKYKSHFEEFQKLSTALGLGKYKGFSKFADKLENVEPAKLVKALSNPENINSLKFFKKELPDSFNEFARYKKSEIKALATGVNGFNPKKALSTLMDSRKFPQEVKEMIFTPQELEALSAAHAEFQKVSNEIVESRLKSQKESRLMNVGYGGNEGKILGGFAGSAFGHGASGALAGTAYDALNNPYKTVKHLVQIEKIVNSVTSKIAKGSKSLFELADKNTIKATEIGVMSLKEQKEEHEKLTESLQVWANNPEKLIDYLSDSTKTITSTAPMISQQLQASSIRAIGFLHSKIPVVPPQKPLSPPMQVSDSDTNRFIRYYDVVRDPFVVYDRINEGVLTAEHMEALSFVYPKLHESMKISAYEEMLKFSKKKDKYDLSNSKKLNIGLFIGDDLTQSLSGQSIRNNMENWANPNLESEKDRSLMITKGNRTGIGNMKIANSTASEISKVENRRKV